MSLVRVLFLTNILALTIWLALPRPSDAQALSLPSGNAASALADPRFTDADTVALPDGRVRMYFEDGAATRSAISADGIAFQEEPGLRLQGRMPAVVALPDGRWRLYHTPADGRGVYSAISQDGLAFENEPGVRLERGPAGASDAFGMIHMTVVADPAGGWRMYYDGVSSPYVPGQGGPNRWTVMSATSPDGLTWTRDASFDLGLDALDGGESSPSVSAAWSPEVTAGPGGFVLYFSAEFDAERHNGIYRAISTDGSGFRVVRRPVLAAAVPTDTPRHTSLGPIGIPQDACVTGGRVYYWLPEEGTFERPL